MSVVIINHSDTRGGASVVSRRLYEALRAEGVDASMLVTHKASQDPGIVLAGNPLSRKLPFIAEHLRILAACRGDRTNLFKISTGTDGLPLDRHPLVRNASTVMLNWVNQGMLSLDAIGRMAAEGKRIIWTMHDMWNATGVCHHIAGKNCDCTSGCCPLTGKSGLCAATWRRKQQLYRNAGITFVAVSNWLAEQCRRSPLMADARIEVIPNVFPIDRFRLEPKRSRAESGLPEGPLILMGAARLDDPIKGLDIAIEALNICAQTEKFTPVFFGAIRRPEILGQLKKPHVHLGTVADQDLLADIYAHSQAVLSASHFETLPGTLVEAQASGAFPVAFDRGGQRDIITAPAEGYLAQYPSASDLAEGLRRALTGPVDRAALRAAAARFSAPAIVEKYRNLGHF